MIKKAIALGILFVFLIPGSIEAHIREIHVSPAGDDIASGGMSSVLAR